MEDPNEQTNLGSAGPGPNETLTGTVTDIESQPDKNLNPDFVSAASDARVVNNDVRHQYRVLSFDEKARMMSLKDAGQALIDLIREQGGSRELSLALTKAEEAVMWAVKHITK